MDDLIKEYAEKVAQDTGLDTQEVIDNFDCIQDTLTFRVFALKRSFEILKNEILSEVDKCYMRVRDRFGY